MSWSRTSISLLVLTLVVGVCAGSGTAPQVGHATGIPVVSERLSTFRPTELPADCPQAVITAGADTWVNEFQPTNNFGTRASLSISARAGRRARTLLHFPLPAVPASCTLTSATLRVYNATAVTTRSVSVVRANAAWAEFGVTWDTQPAMTGTAVDTTAAVGWMQWTVTNHVQAFYAGTNTGFVLRDALEDGTHPSTQAFDSRDTVNPPELTLQWG